MSAGELERGYSRAYRDFYRWPSIVRGAAAHREVTAGLRHLAYAAGWKKFEPLWDLVIRARRTTLMLPVLEAILSEFGRRRPGDVAPAGACHRARRRGPPLGRRSWLILRRRKEQPFGASRVTRPATIPIDAGASSGTAGVPTPAASAQGSPPRTREPLELPACTCSPDALDQFDFGPPLALANLTMIPLLHRAGLGATYLTLDEALATGPFRVIEVSDGRSRP